MATAKKTAQELDEIHQKQVEELEKLAMTKDADALCDNASATACNEDEDSQFHAVHDGIQAGLGRSKKDVWAIQTGDKFPLPSWDVANFVFYIGKSFEEVKAKIEKLPNR